MTDKPKLTLDKNSLQHFVDHDIVDFQDSIDKAAHKDDNNGTPPIDFLLGKGKSSEANDFYRRHAPLAIGALKTDTTTGGKDIAEAITASAQSISGIYKSQIKLFTDLHTYLNNTIKKLMDGQHESLEKIDGKAFLDALGTVPSDFQGNGGTTTT